MNACPHVLDPHRWEALAASAAAVRAEDHETTRAPRSRRHVPIRLTYLALLAGVSVAALHAAGNATPVRADGTADGALFSLTNQDRASNGVRSLNGNGTLGSIGESAGYNGCGFHVNGRSLDMIQRNYFAHPILGCGQYVFSIMQAYGVRYQSAGENIGWNQYGDPGTAAAAINSAFMNSPEHRSNILDGAYTDLGTGSANSGSAAWTGGGGSYIGAWMFSEEFAQIGAPPPPPPPPPPPAPVSPPPPRNTPAPQRPVEPPATTSAPAPDNQPQGTPEATPATPTPAPTPDAGTGTGATPTATETLTPSPSATPSLAVPPILDTNAGLLFDSVEAVLESYLIN